MSGKHAELQMSEKFSTFTAKNNIYMKIRKGFMLCPVMGKTMVIATGQLENSFSGMIKMNEPSAKIWSWIESGKKLEEIYALYADTYNIEATLAKSDVDYVVEKMTKAGVLE